MFVSYQQNQKCLFLLNTAIVCTIHRETALPGASNLTWVLLTGVCVQLSLCLQSWIIVYKINLLVPLPQAFCLDRESTRGQKNLFQGPWDVRRGKPCRRLHQMLEMGSVLECFLPGQLQQYSPILLSKKNKSAFYFG